MNKTAYTEEEILSMDNVPVTVACKYIGMSSATMYRALQEERAPFGFAVPNEEGQWVYNISPGALVRYKRGELPLIKLGEIQELAASGIKALLAEERDALRKNLLAYFG